MRRKRENEKGSITIDFLFALVLVAGLSTVLFSLSITLTVSSIVQYMTFAAARNLNAADADSATQGQQAREKFSNLAQSRVLAPLFVGTWFELQNPDFYGQPGNLQSFRPEFNYQGQDVGQADEFIGFAVTFYARVLDFKIPFFGSTTDEGNGSGDGFKTEIGSFIGKEPSAQQCENFNQARWRAIRRLNVGNGNADYSTNTQETGYIAIGDDGC